MIKNLAGQSIGATVIDASTGGAFTGTVTIYVTGDAGSQAIGSVGSGLCTNEGNSYYTYRPSQAETNYDLIAFTFIGTGAIPSTIQVATLTAAESQSIQVASQDTSITARTLIANTLKDLGVLGAGETMSAEDAEDGLVGLNDLIDSLGTERLLLYSVTRSTWDLVSGQASYTVGPGGDVNIARPVYLDRVNFIDTSVTTPLEYQLGQLLTESAYQAIPQKSLTGDYPVFAYWNPTDASGWGTITFWYVPTSSTLQGVIYHWSAMGLVDLATTIAQPPGYRVMLRTNLAIALADTFTRPITPTMMRRAMESKANIKRTNQRMVDLRLSLPGVSGFYDINSNQVL